MIGDVCENMADRISYFLRVAASDTIIKETISYDLQATCLHSGLLVPQTRN